MPEIRSLEFEASGGEQDGPDRIRIDAQERADEKDAVDNRVRGCVGVWMIGWDRAVESDRINKDAVRQGEGANEQEAEADNHSEPREVRPLREARRR